MTADNVGAPVRRVIVSEEPSARDAGLPLGGDTVFADTHDEGTGGSYDNVIKSLHWLIVGLVIMQMMIGFTMESAEIGTPAGHIVSFHFTTGATIGLIMLFRFGWRMTHHVPAPPRDLPRWLQIVSRANHYYFYAALIAMPVLGLAWASAKGVQPYLFGVIPLPKILETDSPYAEAAAMGHSWLAVLTVAAMALHIAGALYHRFGKHDRTLHRMLPSERA